MSIKVLCVIALLALSSLPACAGEVEDSYDDEGDDILSDMGLGGDDDEDEEDDEGELDDYEDDGEELDDLDNLKEFDLEDDEQRVAALEAELRHFVRSEDYLVIRYKFMSMDKEERLAFIRTIFPGIMIDLTLCWESCVPHGGDPDHPDRGPGTDEQNLREAWIYFPERTEYTLAGLQNRVLFPDGDAGPKSQDFLGGHSLATLGSNFLYNLPFNMFRMGAGWFYVLEQRVAQNSRRRDDSDHRKVLTLEIESGYEYGEDGGKMTDMHVKFRKEALPLTLYLLIEEAKCQWLCEDHGPFYHDVLDNIKTATDLSHTAECECDDDALADVEALRAAGAKWYNHIEIPWFTLIAVTSVGWLFRKIYRIATAPPPPEALARVRAREAKAEKAAAKAAAKGLRNRKKK